MKFFNDTTVWTTVELNISDDESFIEQFNKIFDFYESEYHPEVKMRFYVEILGEDIWIEIERESGMNEDFKLLIDNKEIEFEENTAESILDTIKSNILK